MTTPRVWYVNVFVSDLARSVDFYRGRLGLPLAFADEEHGYASFETDGVRLGVARVDPADAASATLLGRHTGVGLGVPDLDAAYERLRGEGVAFPMAPTKQPWGGYMATLADPDGNVFYLDQLRDE